MWRPLQISLLCSKLVLRFSGQSHGKSSVFYTGTSRESKEGRKSNF